MRPHRGEAGPCECLVSTDEEHGDGHRLTDHEDCGGWTYDPPCGGCHSCIMAQWAHYERLARREAK
jgi:hypothetical protein